MHGDGQMSLDGPSRKPMTATEVRTRNEALYGKSLAGLLGIVGVNHLLTISHDVESEVRQAMLKHPTPMWSKYEAFAILKEEVDELWENIRKDECRGWVRREAIQVAAMAIRMIYDLKLEEGDLSHD